MKKLYLAAAIVLNVCFVACSDKGENVDPPPPPPVTDTTGASATTLAQTVLTSGSDVTTMLYQYDAQKRLAWYSNTSNKALYVEDTTKIIRDAQGMITDLIYRSDTSKKFPDPKIDSVVHKLFLVPGTTKYAYKLLQYKSYNKPFKDSSVYTYDAQNRIVKDEKFYFDYVTTK
ncbi:MAG TPA: hypothetical protein VM010_01325, partial [Chitinophagaceae bacterium]|nr:hypothetical protein [Chitinophagaceae bacterium]